MNFLKRWWIKRKLSKINVSTQCYIDNHIPTIFGVSGEYTMLAHRHDDGVLVIDSFEKKDIKSSEEQIKEIQKKYNIKDGNVFRE